MEMNKKPKIKRIEETIKHMEGENMLLEKINCVLDKNEEILESRILELENKLEVPNENLSKIKKRLKFLQVHKSSIFVFMVLPAVVAHYLYLFFTTLTCSGFTSSNS